MQALSKCIIATAIILGIVILCGIGLRVSVCLLSDQPQIGNAPNVRRVSRSAAEKLSQRDLESERIREQARKDDRAFLQARRDRLWREDYRNRPGKFAAHQRWRREIEEIEAQLAEALAIQNQLTPEESVRGPLAEGTVWWHRQQRLRELQADAPSL